MSVVLLVSAGLTVRTFFVLQNMDAGIKADRVLIVGVPLPPAKYATLEQRNRFAQELLERVGALPGVEAATFGLPFGGPQSPFTIVGQVADDSKRIGINLAGADHLRTFGIPLRGGRMFDASEVRRGDRVAVINEAAVEALARRREPDWRAAAAGRSRASAGADAGRYQPTARGHHHRRHRQHAKCRACAPTRRRSSSCRIRSSRQLQRTLAVRSAGDPNLLLNPVRAQVRAMDADQPLGRPITLSEILGQEVIQPRFTMALFSAFAALGLALAAAGIYSVLSFHVTRRTHELGVRMALGAPRRHVLGLMLTMGGRLVLVGLAIGVGGEPRIHAAAAQPVVRRPAGRSARLRGRGRGARSRGARRLLHSRPARAASVDPMVALRTD